MAKLICATLLLCVASLCHGQNCAAVQNCYTTQDRQCQAQKIALDNAGKAHFGSRFKSESLSRPLCCRLPYGPECKPTVGTMRGSGHELHEMGWNWWQISQTFRS